MDTAFFREWLGGFTEGLEKLDAPTRSEMLRCCAEKCAGTGVLDLYRALYQRTGGDRDAFFARLDELGAVRGEVKVPGSEYEIIFPACVCPLYTSGGVNTPLLCECSRQSILHVCKTLWGDSVSCEVTERDTVLSGAAECRFTVVFAQEEHTGEIWDAFGHSYSKEALIKNMIAWAEQRLDTAKYAGWCLSFIEDALEQGNGLEIFGGDSAKGSGELYADAMQSGEPPRGVFVFYDCLCRDEQGALVNWGHCGIGLGGGKVIHAWDTVRTDDFRQIEKLTALSGDHPKYIGFVPLERVLSQKPEA